MWTVDDRRCMARAIRLAERGLHTTMPNPRVGCVIVRDGEVIAEGWHERAGGPHAETVALRAAAERARGATVYVSLEPCSHHGRTPPCTTALIESGVARVIAAVADPNPRVDRQGLARLQASGIATSCGLLEQQARELNCGFFKRMQQGLPWLRCKLAMSLDGRTAMASGESRWITGAAARADVQRLRARSCAILTGIGTVLADDPRLDVRGDENAPPPRQPLRAIMDSALRLPATARVLAAPGAALVLTADCNSPRREALEASGAQVLALPAGGDGRVDPRAVLALLAERGCNEVLLESGPALAGAFARAGLIDEYVIYVAPMLLGTQARGLLELPIERLSDGLALRISDVRAVGDDWRITAVPAAAAAP